MIIKQVSLHKTADIDSSRSNFERYLRTVFAESHTQQFYYAYKAIDRISVEVGDFIVKKRKGHAVLVVDLAKNANGVFVAVGGHSGLISPLLNRANAMQNPFAGRP